MKPDASKMQLTEAAAAQLAAAQTAAAGEFLEGARPRANVLGLGLGVKWTDGQPTGEPALVVLVNQKLPKESVAKSDLIPARLQDVQTDVLSIGEPFAGGAAPQDVEVETLAKRVRPARGGYSVGHKDITAGTIATGVYDLLPGATISPPAPGVGIPRKFYILSNNHVLADSNAAALGDAVLQPGPFDGGADPADRIARLSRFIPITFSPPVPLALHRNLVDAAVAEVQFHDLDREIYWSGPARAWRRKSLVLPGMIVKKTGRTTNFTTGRITVVNATVDVNYGGGRVARFRDQIITTAMSAGGDSGSLVTTLDNVAVGLLFAGSPVVTIANQIENVRAALRVEVAESLA
jgi:hypothetical protein